MDDWDAEAGPLEDPDVIHRTAPDPDAIRRFAGILGEARSPAVVTGAGVERSGAFHDAVMLAEKLAAPVWQAPISALASFPQDHPLFQGHLPPAQKQLAERLSGHVVVLVLGAPVFLYYPYDPGPTVEEGTQVLRVSEDPAEAARASVGTSLVGDVGLAIRGLLESLPASGP